MKHAIKDIVLLFVFSAVFASQPLYSQEWSAEQKEVWKNVEAYWDLDAKRDLEGFMSYFHSDYSGWYTRTPLPDSKSALRKWLTQMYKNRQTLVHDIRPVAIKIYGDIAFVHYYHMQLIKDPEGKELNEQGRWTDILKKQGDEWVIIGDHGGPK